MYVYAYVYILYASPRSICIYVRGEWPAGIGKLRSRADAVFCCSSDRMRPPVCYAW